MPETSRDGHSVGTETQTLDLHGLHTRSGRFGVGSAVFSALAAVVVAIAVFFSVQSATSGTDVRSHMTLIAPAAAGGGWDTFQREMQQTLRANQIVNNVQVVNIPGAGGTIGLGQLSQMSEPNVLMVGGTGQIAAQIDKNTPAKIQDVQPVARVVEEYDLVVVPADSPYQDMAELVQAWKRNPQALAWSGGGSFDQLVVTEIAVQSDVPPSAITFIPADGGGEVVQAMLNGTVQAATGGVADMYPHVESGRLRVLGVASEERLEGLDVPTLREQGLDVTLTNWRALFAPPGLSAEQIDQLQEVVAEAVQTPEWQATVERNYWRAVPLQDEEMDTFVQDEIDRIRGLYEEIGS
ncbi:tripartite tricarboxylate transporter substrate binding protein [Micrococcus sp.]|uniref:Bug family tripartite tricarboxylate transporter substrate binding protein n=1 Tax=Micrococcus sp. TaxID=1271 RepID=UPI002A910902|nr:tripartite tricarboxylate transporter substrate binding protein [Micrococcus sp.]